MYPYGDKWHQAINKMLKRLALYEKPGFLVLDGPKGSGKTDLLDLVRKTTQHRILGIEQGDKNASVIEGHRTHW